MNTHTPPELLLPNPKAHLAFVLTGILLHISPPSSSHSRSALPSLSVFFHSLRCQELNDTAELTGCYGNRLVIGQEDRRRVRNDCGWGCESWLSGWVGAGGSEWHICPRKSEEKKQTLAIPPGLHNAVTFHWSLLTSTQLIVRCQGFIPFPRSLDDSLRGLVILHHGRSLPFFLSSLRKAERHAYVLIGKPTYVQTGNVHELTSKAGRTKCTFHK